MKQINISIQLSFHDIILLSICLYSVDVFALMTVYYYYACDGYVAHGTIQLSIATYLEWNLFADIGLVHNLNDVLVEMEGI